MQIMDNSSLRIYALWCLAIVCLILALANMSLSTIGTASILLPMVVAGALFSIPTFSTQPNVEISKALRIRSIGSVLFLAGFFVAALSILWAPTEVLALKSSSLMLAFIFFLLAISSYRRAYIQNVFLSNAE